jgi:signal transduction histidine kinase
MTSKSRNLWPYYVPLVLLLGAYEGLNELIPLRSIPGLAAWKPLSWGITAVLVFAALAPLVVRFENRFRLDSRPRTRIVLAHLAAAVVFSVVQTTLTVSLRKLLYWLASDAYTFGNVAFQGFYELQRDLIVYAIVLVIVFAVREFRNRRARELRAAEMAAELSEARLRHLTTQIEPHFLFNCLNAISNRMHEDVAAADRMISQLGDLLRAAYETDRDMLVPLERELGWLRGYTGMMGERFRGQLAFEVEVEPGLEAVRVPRLLLQPLVENALKHGLGEGRGRLHVDVRRDGRCLQYTVSDDGAGLSGPPLAPGTGLSNISRRLELLFPGDHTFELSARTPRGVVATVRFPVAARSTLWSLSRMSRRRVRSSGAFSPSYPISGSSRRPPRWRKASPRSPRPFPMSCISISNSVRAAASRSSMGFATSRLRWSCLRRPTRNMPCAPSRCRRSITC